MSLILAACAERMKGRGISQEERDQRLSVCSEALSWLGTRYHPHARVKNGGVDCATFLLEVFQRRALVEPYDPGYYAPDWHMHRNEELYLKHIERFCVKKIEADGNIEDALPGDVPLFQFGRTISHGAIMLHVPVVIHSYVQRGVILDDMLNGYLAGRFRGVWSYWSKK